MHLVGGRAKACEIYYRILCEAMLRGFKHQLVADGLKNSDKSLSTTRHNSHQNHDWETYYSDLSNLQLRSDLIDKAMQEEMEVFAKSSEYTKVQLQDAYHFTGKGPIGKNMWM